jgi:hypothetical protein
VQLTGQDDLLKIRIHEASAHVDIASTRTLGASRVFVNKEPEQVVRLLPTLFSVCGTAQAIASLQACETALGYVTSVDLQRQRLWLLYAETAKEHLWRLLLDWPRVLGPILDVGLKPDEGMQAFAAFLRTFIRIRTLLQEGDHLFQLKKAQQQIGNDHEQAASLLLTELGQSVMDLALQYDPAGFIHDLDSVDALRDWARKTPTIPARLVLAIDQHCLASTGVSFTPKLPNLPLAELGQRLAASDADRFIAQPQWLGSCHETGPLARTASHPLIAALIKEYGSGLLARLAALLIEIARSAEVLRNIIRPNTIPQSIPSSVPGKDLKQTSGLNAKTGSGFAFAHPPPSLGDMPCSSAAESLAGALASFSSDSTNKVGSIGAGIAQIEAARGRLVHRVVIEDDLVQEYQILAPTEWNFHPQGVVAQGLAAIAASGVRGERLERLARLHITAVDPCVEYRLSVS